MYLVKMNIGAGGSWAKGETKEAALLKCFEIAKQDWSGLYDLDAAQKAGALVANVFEDGGTDSFEDDTFIEAVTL